MKMKTKLLTLSVVLVMSTIAMQAQMGFGLLGGVNLQNINGKDANGDKYENGLMVGFHAGVNVNIPIAPDFYFQPGLLFSVKGAKDNFFNMPTKAANDNYNTTTKISYIEIPLNLLFRPQFGNGHILLGFGPYVAMGIGGNQKFESGTLSYEQKIVFKNEITQNEFWDIDNAYYRRFDAGANIFAGYEMPMGIFLQLNTQLGMLKINPAHSWDTGDKTSYRNTGYGISFGYRF
jgi:hypothetical protein